MNVVIWRKKYILCTTFLRNDEISKYGANVTAWFCTLVSWLIEFYFISRWDILTEILEAQKQRAARQGIDMEKVQLSHKFDLKEGK